ncbi:MAG: TetR/AcrR family transcriptional regulator [Tepidibacter sp.]|jgi:AcrR family transcriptional regulator|uniref:TetR/AcrR family transcriptional regulator n=1 Tax=Tepidibacter sp. TaxID=2529387 RepID=UPI0025D42E1B|nr:TetR/AcrR family transcriptional regulator [Tepidibacter sp.]MCT4508552.1 TetR/AcrR family transcriptional regulator [Tepidibacter sp.]
MDSRSSKEKILQASMNLFVRNGYKKTTTKLIAKEAGVNEVTIFRLFGKKKSIIEEIIKYKMSNMNPLTSYFKNDVKFNLSEDLYKSSVLYFNSMSKNLPLMLTLLEELGEDFEHIFSKLPKRVKEAYKSYFDEMYTRGIIIEPDTEFLALSFSTLIVGLAVTKVMTNKSIIELPTEEFIKKNTEIFARGILK